jgi:maltooligosyltrehalose trehalohydrolase
MDGAVLGPDAFVLRFFGKARNDRLLIVNLGRDLDLSPAPEPLLAPPWGHDWRLLWSSEEPRYGGSGTPPIEPEGSWTIPGHCAIVMQAVKQPQEKS